jgi:hypothetical protein
MSRVLHRTARTAVTVKGRVTLRVLLRYLDVSGVEWIVGIISSKKIDDDGFKSDQQQGLARDDARNEHHELGAWRRRRRRRRTGRGMLLMQMQRVESTRHACLVSVCVEWYSCAPPAAQIARLRHLLACYSSITRPSCDHKRQRSPHETMRPLGACRSRR